MSDPIRYKPTQEIFIEAKYKVKEVEDSMRLYVLSKKEIIERTPQEEMRKALEADIQKVSPTPVSGIYKTHLSYQYSDKDALKDFDFGNILVQAHLPYCLHIPHHYEMTVSVSEQKLEALVIFEKLWTHRAQEDGKKSDIVDFFAEDRSVYFKNSVILTPKVPFKPEEGWDSYFTGRNIEKMRDQNGVFRFTRLHIQFNMTLPEKLEELGGKASEKLLKEVQDKALHIVNRVIDNYREVTNEIHVRRLGELKVNLVYFIPQNQGYYFLLPNIETAMMNRSRKEIETLADRLSKGEKPDLYKLLLLNARNSFATKDFTLAIVESFQALEVYLENYIITESDKRGDTEEQYKNVLETNWRTKDRLNAIVKSLKGSALNEQTDLWNKWCYHYERTRNEVLHAGKEPDDHATEETLIVNEKVIAWVSSL
jgi:hypothetical protein